MRNSEFRMAHNEHKNELPQVDSKKPISFPYFTVHFTVQVQITHSKHKRLLFVNDRRMKS